MNTFKEAVAKRDFVITAEGFLKPETDAEAIRFQADVLREHVDAVLLTDNQFGALHMSTVAAARLMLDNDLDPIVQLSCRNRNRVSLLAEQTSALGGQYREAGEQFDASNETVLRFLDELNYEEIAEITKCEIGTVKSRVHYAKRALKQILKLEHEQ